jgi:dihydroxyacetone kinase-like predicted kinase
LHTDDDDPQNLYVSKVSDLYEDLTEEHNIDLTDHADLPGQIETKKHGRKNKIAVDNLKVRHSSRIRKNQMKYLVIVQALIWNSEGFKDIAKHLFIQESIREHKLDIVEHRGTSCHDAHAAIHPYMELRFKLIIILICDSSSVCHCIPERGRL